MIMTHDLRPVMAKLDIELLLNSLGIKFLPGLRGTGGNNIVGYCPDHHLFTGQFPSHPKWYLNIETGTTYCFTESRGSDILHTIRRFSGCSLGEAKKILESGVSSAPSKIKYKLEARKKIEYKGGGAEKTTSLENNKTLQSLIPLFGKKGVDDVVMPFFYKDGIGKDILNDFGIISLETGKYRDRIVMPFRSDFNDDVVGFVAVDVLGKKKWVRNKVTKYSKSNEIKTYSDLYKCVKHYWKGYRKALYCKGVATGSHLFGLRNLVKRGVDLSEVVIVEGERDALKLQQEGFNALGTHGTHLTINQRELLKKYNVKRIMIAFDGDKPGREAAERVYNSICSDYERVLNLDVPENKDPKKFYKEDFLLLIEGNKGEEKGFVKTTKQGYKINEHFELIKKYRRKGRNL